MTARGKFERSQRAVNDSVSYSPFRKKRDSNGASQPGARTRTPIGQDASCSKCDKLTDEKPPFCTWMKAEVPPGLADDPDCEGFTPKTSADSAEVPGTSKGKERTAEKPTVEKPRKVYLIIGRKGMGMTEMPIPLKANEKRVDKLGIEPSKTACPKTFAHHKTDTDPVATLPQGIVKGKTKEKVPDKDLIQTALKLKAFKGSVVMERICCGKPGCRCHTGALHGPYPYLHYYSNGKVKRHYLSKALSALLSYSTEELEKMLHAAGSENSEPEALSGQGE